MTKKTENTSKGTDKTDSAGAMGTKITPIGKITTTACCGKLDVSKLPEDGSEIEILKIAGFSDGVKSGATTYGPWHALTGEFAATNMGTGEIFIAKTTLIPSSMGEALVTATEEALRNDANARVKFSVMVSVKRSPRDPANKYEFVVRPILEMEFKSPALALLGA